MRNSSSFEYTRAAHRRRHVAATAKLRFFAGSTDRRMIAVNLHKRRGVAAAAPGRRITYHFCRRGVAGESQSFCREIAVAATRRRKILRKLSKKSFFISNFF